MVERDTISVQLLESGMATEGTTCRSVRPDIAARCPPSHPVRAHGAHCRRAAC